MFYRLGDGKTIKQEQAKVCIIFIVEDEEEGKSLQYFPILKSVMFIIL